MKSPRALIIVSHTHSSGVENVPFQIDVASTSVLSETITKFSNAIGYQQPDLSTNRTVYTSCL